MAGEPGRARTLLGHGGGSSSGSPIADSTGFLPLIGLVLFVAAASFATAKIGLPPALIQPGAAAVWLPAGVALAALLVLGYRSWPGVFMGAFFFHLEASDAVAASFGMAAGSTLEALAGAWLLNRFADGLGAFRRMPGVLMFAVLAALGSTMAGATSGTASLLLEGLVLPADAGRVWLASWFGDAVGVLVAAPPLVLWCSGPKLRWRGRRSLEAAVLGMCLATLSLLAFDARFLGGAAGHPLKSIAIPPLLWAAYRFGPRGAATAVLLLYGGAAYGVLDSPAALPEGPFREGWLALQAFLGAASVTSLSLAAAVSEHARAMDEVRESEERYRLVLETATDAVLTVDSRGRIHLANAAAEKLFGYTRAEMLNRPLTMLMPEASRTRHLAAFQEYLATCKRHLPWRGTEHSVLHKDGREVPVEISFGEYWAGGERFFIGIIRDLTKRKAAEEVRARMEDEMRQSQKMEAIGRLASGIVHELNSPLHSILTLSALLEEKLERVPLPEAEAEEVRKIAEILRKGAHRSACIVRNLLAFARRGLRQTVALDLSDVLRSAVELVDHAFSMQGVRIEVAFPSAPARVLGDSDALQQMVVNLLVNARDAMGRGGTITLSARRAGDRVEVSVGDEGIGMAPEVQARIFEPFFTTKPSGSGTGLGLSLVHAIVRDHGGAISVESAPGRGSVFRIQLPLLPPGKSGQAASLETSETALPGSGASGEPRRPVGVPGQ